MEIPKTAAARSGRLSIGMVWVMLAAWCLYQVANYSVTHYALHDLLGDLGVAGVSWATALSVAFVGIDLAVLGRLLAPDDEDADDFFYLTGVWLLAATMNALLVWWGISLAWAQKVEGAGWVPVLAALAFFVARVVFAGAFITWPRQAVVKSKIYRIRSDFPNYIPFGYHITDQGSQQIEADAPDVIARAFALAQQGAGFGQIALFLSSQEAGELSAGPNGRGWQAEAVRQWMGDPIHAGYAVWSQDGDKAALVPYTESAYPAPPVDLATWFAAFPDAQDTVTFPAGKRQGD